MVVTSGQVWSVVNPKSVALGQFLLVNATNAQTITNLEKINYFKVTKNLSPIHELMMQTWSGIKTRITEVGSIKYELYKTAVYGNSKMDFDRHPSIAVDAFISSETCCDLDL